jgi:hypothetical protein
MQTVEVFNEINNFLCCDLLLYFDDTMYTTT